MNSIRNKEERFTYDMLDRLTGVIEGIDTTGVFTYDGYGRMTMKRLHGAMVFDNTAYGADGRPHALERARMYDELPEHSIRYTSFDKILSIQQDEVMLPDYGLLRFEYGYGHQRLRTTEFSSPQNSVVKVYIGSCEFVETNGVTTSECTFLSGPLGVFAVYDGHILPEGKGMYYVHPDHLGSWTTVTSTFLSVDNYVQDPSSTQNFNRYAYCMNNPLKYVDPDGEWAHLAIGALIGGIVNLATNWSSINTFGEGLAYFGIGAAAGALSAGVGMGVSSWIGGGTFGAGFIGSRTAETAVSSFASGSVIGGSTGFTQGFITGSGNSWMQGKTFGQGLLQGVYAGVSGLINGGINGGIMAGFDALSHGRKFWSGDYVESVSRDYPVGPNYCQSGDDCTITTSKTIYDYDHPSDISYEQLKTDCNKGLGGPVKDANYWSKYGERYGYKINQFSRLPDSELLRPSTSSLIDDFNNGH